MSGRSFMSKRMGLPVHGCEQKTTDHSPGGCRRCRRCGENRDCRAVAGENMTHRSQGRRQNGRKAAENAGSSCRGVASCGTGGGRFGGKDGGGAH